ncbi:hypothetical protein BDF22DRAFT_646875 [Syncephalis plumigaleata]|nr:hypothetical protein BDF22DRAFT_646875 [Syncephalis plumigaleata]
MLKSPTRDSNNNNNEEPTVQPVSDPTEQITTQPVWNTLNNLLLLQAIYHYGDDRWPTVSRILRQHRLITQPEALTPKNCEKQYKQLIADLEEERKSRPEEATGTSGARDMPAVMKLAGRFHALRVEELKQSIKEDEDRLRTLVEEIHQIRTGQWDEYLIKNSDKVLTTAAATAAAVNSKPDTMDIDNEKTATTTTTTTTTTTEQTVAEVPQEESKHKEQLKKVENKDALAKLPITKAESSSQEHMESKQSDDQLTDIPATTVQSSDHDDAQLVDAIRRDSATEMDVDQEKESSNMESDTEITDAALPAPMVTRSHSARSTESNPDANKDKSSIVHDTSMTDINTQTVDNAINMDTTDTDTKTTRKRPTPMDLSDDTQRVKRETATESTMNELEREEVSTAELDTHTALAEGETGMESEREPGHWSKTSSPITRPEMTAEEEVERLKTWRKLVLMIWRDLANHRYASIFAQPIRRQQAPGYYDIVRRPMDLNTVRKRVRDSKINTTDEFHHDMLLIFQNALMYNPVGSEIYQMALEMMEEVDRAIVAFRQTESTAWQAGHRRRKSNVGIDTLPSSVKSRSSSPPLLTVSSSSTSNSQAATSAGPITSSSPTA